MTDWPECKWAGDHITVRSGEDRYEHCWCHAAPYYYEVALGDCQKCPQPADQERLAQTESVVRLLTAALRDFAENPPDLSMCPGHCESCTLGNCDVKDALAAAKELGLEKKI